MSKKIFIIIINNIQNTNKQNTKHNKKEHKMLDRYL